MCFSSAVFLFVFFSFARRNTQIIAGCSRLKARLQSPHQGHCSFFQTHRVITRTLRNFLPSPLLSPPPSHPTVRKKKKKKECRTWILSFPVHPSLSKHNKDSDRLLPSQGWATTESAGGQGSVEGRAGGRQDVGGRRRWGWGAVEGAGARGAAAELGKLFTRKGNTQMRKKGVQTEFQKQKNETQPLACFRLVPLGYCRPYEAPHPPTAPPVPFYTGRQYRCSREQTCGFPVFF